MQRIIVYDIVQRFLACLKPMSLIEFIAKQLRKPSGWFGRQITARLLNRLNEPVNTLTLDLLAVQPADRILEVGFGGAALLGRIAARATDGLVVGVDFAPEMVDRGAARYRALVEAGRVAFRCANAEALPYPDGHFTKACTVNTIYFWENPPVVLGEFRRVLVEGGVLLVGFSPKNEMKDRPFAGHGFTLYDEESVRQLMQAAGFSAVQIVPGQAGKRAFSCAVGTKGESTGTNSGKTERRSFRNKRVRGRT